MTKLRLPLVILLIVAIVLLLLTRLSAGLDDARVLVGGKPLLFSLLTRSRTGDLALGPSTPPIWALGRAPAPADSIMAGPARPGQNTAALRAQVETALARAAQRLRRAGDAERLAGIALGSRGEYADAQGLLSAGTSSLDAAVFGTARPEGKIGQFADPEDPFVRLAAGNVLDATGQRQAALAAWQEIGALRPISFQLYREGVQLANRGQRAQAEQLLLLATEIDPGYADPYHALGGFYWGADDEKSAQMYRTALEAGGLAPFFARLAEGKLALLENRPQDAVLALDEAVQLEPKHADANQFLGIALRRVGRAEEAVAYLETAARLDPQSPWPLIQAGQAYLELHRTNDAIRTLTAAIDRRADLPLAFDLLAQANFAAGRPEQAAAAWQQAALLNPNNVSFRVRIGDAWQQAGRSEEAIAAYQAVLALEPANSYVLRQLERLGVQPEAAP